MHPTKLVIVKIGRFTFAHFPALNRRDLQFMYKMQFLVMRNMWKSISGYVVLHISVKYELSISKSDAARRNAISNASELKQI